MMPRMRDALCGPPTQKVGHGQGASFILLLLLLTACAAAPLAPASTLTPTRPPTLLPPTPISGALFVNAAQPLGSISPYVFGTNYGPWVFLMPAVKPQAVAAGFKYLRYPGGEYGDSVDLMEYQVDEAAALAKDLGADLALSVRLMNGTPENAANLVKYANKTKGYHVKFWSIGNEPSLYFKRSDGLPGYDTRRFNQEWRKFAEAMRAVDPTIKLVGPDTNQFREEAQKNPKDPNGLDWMEEFLKANGDLVDIVAFHRYPFPLTPGDPPPTREQLLAASEEWDRIIPALRRLIKETTGKDKPIAITEVNSNWAAVSGGEATPETLYNALWWGDSLGRMMRQGVDIVAQFLLTSHSGAGGGEMGLLARDDARPTYYVYPMYQKFGRTLLPVAGDDDAVSIFAAKRDDGALTLIAINRSDKTTTRPLQLNGFAPSGPAEVWRLDKTHKAEKIEPQKIADGATVTLPPYSMTLYVLQ